jgi:uncharacterized membrane protein YedE/YeeE
MSVVVPPSAALWAAVGGGALIGWAASLLLSVNGRIAGISSIVHGLFSSDGHELLWRGLFVAGLLAGGFLFFAIDPRLALTLPSSTTTAAVAGLLVGIGTRVSGGCTSGHGVCGLSRLSKRSFAATLTFIITGMLTVALMRHWGGIGR